MNSKDSLRMTRQREVIIEELKKVRSHPTADEVYRMVRRRLPKISLGTVKMQWRFFLSLLQLPEMGRHGPPCELSFREKNGAYDEMRLRPTQGRTRDEAETHPHP